MHRSTSLRRVLLGLAFAGSLGFGGSQALAAPAQAAAMGNCPVEGYDYYYYPCAYSCPYQQGYCSARGYCQCGWIP